jgi:hypothetical protein
MKESLTILVAENDYQLQGLLEEALVVAGFQPQTLFSTEEAATLLGSGIFRYRALVTDVNPDRKDGRVGPCPAGARTRSRLPGGLHDRRRRRRVVPIARAKQHASKEAVRAGSTGHGALTASVGGD